MAVDEEIAVRAVLVLADARLDERRAGERGKALREVAPAHRRARRGGAGAIAVVRIDGRAVRVVRHLEAATLDVGHAVEDSPSLKSAQTGQAPGSKRASPAGGAKKNTSWRVGKMRGAQRRRETASAATGRRRRRTCRRRARAVGELHGVELLTASGGSMAAIRYSPPAFTNSFTSVCTARRAMSMPYSGSNSPTSTSFQFTCGKRFSSGR